nr:immunoglobulin heavy chain junction region [Mus musculus]
CARWTTVVDGWYFDVW